MTRAVLSIFAIALLLSATAAQMRSVTRGGKKVDFIECEKCEMLAKWSEDGTYATINLSRLRDGNPSAAELSRRESETLERVLAAMAMAPVKQPRRIVRSDDMHVVATNSLPGSVELAVENKTGEVRRFSFTLAELGLPRFAHALDMTDRAMLPDVRDALVVLVPPHETKVYRLFPTTR